MVREVVVESILSDEMIKAGVRILEQLDRNGFDTVAAFWLRLPESSQWRFMIASPDVATLGPTEVYGRIQNILAGMRGPRLSLQGITVVDAKDPLVLLLRSAIVTAPGAADARIRFTRGVINGMPIEGAYIYRIKQAE